MLLELILIAPYVTIASCIVLVLTVAAISMTQPQPIVIGFERAEKRPRDVRGHSGRFNTARRYRTSAHPLAQQGVQAAELKWLQSEMPRQFLSQLRMQ